MATLSYREVNIFFEDKTDEIGLGVTREYWCPPCHVSKTSYFLVPSFLANKKKCYARSNEMNNVP
jgi:hypothetical protein